MTAFEFTDRYQAMGIPYPDQETMCKGQCEGTGFVPVSDAPEEGGVFQTLWEQAHAERCNFFGMIRLAWNEPKPRYWWYLLTKGRCDGWHFVKCPDCDGTGKTA